MEPPESQSSDSSTQSSYQRRRSRRRRSRRTRRVAAWLMRNGLDLSLNLLFLFGIVLLFNPLRLLAAPGRFELGLARWLVHDGGTQSIGGLILVATMLIGAIRLRWRINANKAWWARHCPECGGTQLGRMHRKWYDRVLNAAGIPVRRYVCRECHWRGPRIDDSHIHY